jgi:type IV pilus assembly protein PilQ
MNGLAINTREMQTKVLVANGETIVLGGIYEQTKKKKTTRVPILGRLPLVGVLFRSAHNLDLRQELIIFVTPKIIKENVGCT